MMMSVLVRRLATATAARVVAGCGGAVSASHNRHNWHTVACVRCVCSQPGNSSSKSRHDGGVDDSVVTMTLATADAQCNRSEATTTSTLPRPPPSSSSQPPRTQAPTRADDTVTSPPASAVVPPYRSFSRVVSLDDFRARYDAAVRSGEQLSDVRVRVGGRVTSVRDMGRIVFVTLRGGAGGGSGGVAPELQIVRRVGADCTAQELRRVKEQVRVGDIVGAVGVPGRTHKGELSLYADTLEVVTPCTCSDLVVCAGVTRRQKTSVPSSSSSSSSSSSTRRAAADAALPVEDKDIRYRYRFIDLLTNPRLARVVCQRHAIVKCLRGYLDTRGFVEVETPMLHSVASGAHARPFVTHHNAADTDLYLRIAPELYLKQCVVGGLERVYELGRVFRNEDADRSHNPEFTSCELYAAYHDCDDLLPLTEDLLRQLALAANGHTRVTVTSCVTRAPVELDLAHPFRRVHAYEAVVRACGVELPPAAELDTPCGMAYMSALLLRHGIAPPPVRTAAKLFDCLLDHFVTSKVVEPTFVMGHPLCMSPLAKEDDAQRGCAERFELFINGVEYCNAYSELADPQEQYRRFQRQLRDRHRGDDEAMSLDETFLKALQVGLPPTAGWGLGVDRVVALLCGCDSIRDALLFPLLRHDANSHDAKRRRRTAAFFGFSEHMTLFCLSALEAELARRGAPAYACAHVRQLREYILNMQQEQRPEERTRATPADVCDDVGDHDDAAMGVRAHHYDKWRNDAAAALVRFLCRTRD